MMLAAIPTSDRDIDVELDFSDLLIGGSPVQRPRVLVVDDSSTIRRCVLNFLVALPIELVFAEDGYEALQVIQSDPLPSLIFADVLMPRLNGYQLCALAKKQPRSRSIPFYVLSSKDGAVDKAYANLCGVDGYMIKPFKKPDLCGKVKQVLNLID